MSLPDDTEEVLVLLLHLIVVEFLHLSVDEAGRRWVGAQIADLHLAKPVHADNHAPDAADGLYKGLHGHHGRQPRTPYELHLLEDHEVANLRAEEQVAHGWSIRRLLRQLVGYRGANSVLAEPLLQTDAAVLLDREDGVLANDDDLLLTCRQRSAEARHRYVLCMLADVRRPVHLHLLTRGALPARVLVDVLGGGSKHLIAVGFDAHGIAADDEGVDLRHVAERAWHQETGREQATECKRILLEEGKHPVE
mmetsp:Transcript_105716/g.309213  ORF Transcript_105716/g.309213 Transcript_105716/m.309213 type:complete len:251 (-) Transcript_105716:492-1244(-)